jgi:hypothetical protein
MPLFYMQVAKIAWFHTKMRDGTVKTCFDSVLVQTTRWLIHRQVLIQMHKKAKVNQRQTIIEMKNDNKVLTLPIKI